MSIQLLLCEDKKVHLMEGKGSLVIESEINIFFFFDWMKRMKASYFVGEILLEAVIPGKFSNKKNSNNFQRSEKAH